MDLSTRLVVIQDGGLRAKTTLFDSQNRLTRDAHHTPAELATLLFGGSGMTMSQHAVSVKIHSLPALPALPSSVLISRLFSLDSSFQKKHLHSNSSGDWAPEPVLDSDDVPTNENASTRFAIAIILPISDSFEVFRDTITENWLQISNSFLALQNIIVTKLKAIHVNNSSRLRKPQSQHFQTSQIPHQYMVHRQSCNDVGGYLGISSSTSPSSSSFNTNSINGSGALKRLSFSKYCLQSEIELYHSLSTFTKMIMTFTKTPRLFYDLKHSNQMLINWAANLSAWMLLKDNIAPTTYAPQLNSQTQTHSHFIVFMLSVLLPVRDQFFSDPLSADTLDLTRLVIATGNPAISEKLIFIISGLLGYEYYGKLYDQLNHFLSLSSNAIFKSSSGINSNFAHLVLDKSKYGYRINTSSTSKNNIPSPSELAHEYKSDQTTSKPIPMVFERPNSPSLFKSHDKVSNSLNSMLTPSPNSRGWSPSISNSYKMNESDKVSISSKSGLFMASTIVDDDSWSSSPPSSEAKRTGIAHSKSIPIKGVNSTNVQTAPRDIEFIPALNRSNSYASLQNISESYGTTTPTSSLGFIGSWRNMSSWVDRWKWNPPMSPRQNSRASTLGSSLGRNAHHMNSNGRNASDSNGGSEGFGTPSPNLGPQAEDDWDDATFDTNYSTTPKKSFVSESQPLKAQVTESERSDDSFRSKSISSNFNGNFPGFGFNYKCKGSENHVQRSTGYLKTIRYQKLEKSINDVIDELLNCDNIEEKASVERLESGVTISKVNYPSNSLLKTQMENISSTTTIRLPLLVGYINEYHPEFTLLSCPVTNPSVANGVAGPTVGSNVLENVIYKTIKEDIVRSKRASKLWLVNVGMRWVKLFEASSTEKLVITSKASRPSMQMRSMSSNSGIETTRNYNERKSNLTSHLQKGDHLGNDLEVAVTQKMVFASNVCKTDDGLPNENLLFIVNETLIKITNIVNTFVSDVHETHLETYEVIKMEESCCNEIREVIDDLLSNF